VADISSGQRVPEHHGVRDRNAIAGPLENAPWRDKAWERAQRGADLRRAEYHRDRRRGRRQVAGIEQRVDRMGVDRRLIPFFHQHDIAGLRLRLVLGAGRRRAEGRSFGKLLVPLLGRLGANGASRARTMAARRLFKPNGGPVAPSDMTGVAMNRSSSIRQDANAAAPERGPRGPKGPAGAPGASGASLASWPRTCTTS
jgi:hypothetical protein